MLHVAARDGLRGWGEIVDTSASLGAGTRALAAGLSENATATVAGRKVHAYDWFLNRADHRRLLGQELEPYASFEPRFHEHLRGLERYVNVYPGNVATARWIGRPIQTFLAGGDVPADPRAHAHIYREFARWWIPGRTLYIQRQFMDPNAPWVHVAIGFLLDHLEILGVEAPSAVLGVAGTIPTDALARVAADDFAPRERIAYVDRLFEAIEHDEARGTLLLVQAVLHAREGDPAEACAGGAPLPGGVRARRRPLVPRPRAPGRRGRRRDRWDRLTAWPAVTEAQHANGWMEKYDRRSRRLTEVHGEWRGREYPLR